MSCLSYVNSVYILFSKPH